jgi:hypothetical protein
LGVTPFHPYKTNTYKTYKNLRDELNETCTFFGMTLEHVSSIFNNVVRDTQSKINYIAWKLPGEANFKFDYIRVLKETEMPLHLKYTALQLATSFYSGGEVGITYETLSRHMGVTPRTAMNNVNDLVKLGWIARESGRTGVANQYQGHIPDHLPSVNAAMDRLQEMARKRLAKKANDTPPDMVTKFIARMYANKGLAEHLEQDLIEKSMNTLRKTVKALLDRDDSDYTFARTVLERLSKWPLPEHIGSRPHMFSGALHHQVPFLRDSNTENSLPLALLSDEHQQDLTDDLDDEPF